MRGKYRWLGIILKPSLKSQDDIFQDGFKIRGKCLNRWRIFRAIPNPTNKAPFRGLTCCGAGVGHKLLGLLVLRNTARTKYSRPRLAIASRYAPACNSRPHANKFACSRKNHLRGWELHPGLEVMSLSRYYFSTPLSSEEITRKSALKQIK